MRITHVNKYYWPPHIGGVEAQLHDLATGQAALSGVRARAIVANEGRDTVSETVEGVEVTRLARVVAPSNTPITLSMPRAIRSEASRSEPADILHLHFPYPWGEMSWLRSGVDVPTVLSYHSDIVRQKRLLAAYGPILGKVLDRVDMIVTSSTNMVEYSPFLSKVAGKCRIVPYGIRVERYGDAPELVSRAKALRAAHQRPVVLFVGRLVYYKGAEVLIRAMADVDADLVIVGRGPLESSLRELAVAARVSDRVTWLPPLYQDALAAWFRAADVFCLPSVARSEAFGIVQLEAHASGTPVVATTLTTSVPCVNVDRVTGLNVPPGDASALAEALRLLLEDEPLRTRLGSQARERALREYTVERMVDDTMRVYSEAAGTSLPGVGRAGAAEGSMTRPDDRAREADDR